MLNADQQFQRSAMAAASGTSNPVTEDPVLSTRRRQKAFAADVHLMQRFAGLVAKEWPVNIIPRA